MKSLFLILTFFYPFINFSQEVYLLKYSFNTPDSYRVTTKIISKSTQDINGEKQTINSEYQLNYRFDIQNKTDSVYNCELTFTTISNKLNQNDINVIFHSDSSSNDISEKYHSFLAKKLKFSLSPFGKLSPQYSVDSLFSDSSEFNSKELFSQSINQKITELLPVQIPFPGKSIAENTDFKINDTIKSGIFFKVDRHYKLDSVKNSNFYISEKAKIISKKNNSVRIKNVYISYNVTGENFSSFTVNKQTGVITFGICKKKIRGNASIRYTKNSEPAYSWPIQISETTIIKTEKIN